MEPRKAFDDLYWMGTGATSTWLLTSDDGYILYDTAAVYDAEDVLVGGIKKLGLDPAKVSYVIVSHAHRGEVRRRLSVPVALWRAHRHGRLGYGRGVEQRLSDRQAQARHRRRPTA